MVFAVGDGAQAPGLAHAVGRRHVAVGDERGAALRQRVYGVLVHAGPAEPDLRIGICQLRAEGEGVDGGRYAQDRIAGDIADGPAAAERAGDGAGDELALIDAAVVGAHPRVGHGDGAAQHPHVGVRGGDLAARADERRRGAEDDLRAVADGFLHHRLRVLRAIVGLAVHALAEHRLDILPPEVVGVRPVALFRQMVADEGEVQPAGEHRLDDTADDIRLRLGLLRLRADRDGLALRRDAHVRPYGVQRLVQLRGGHGLELIEGVELEEHQQRVGTGDAELFTAQLLERFFKRPIAGEEAAPLRLGPDVLRLIAQRRLQLREASRAAEQHLIEPRQLVGVHEVVVRLNGAILRPRGHDPHHIRGDGRRAVALEHADSLVALLHVEAPEVLKAPHRLADALVAQMRGAECDPLGRELAVGRHQRHKVGGERVAPSLGLGAGDAVRRDLQ